MKHLLALLFCSVCFGDPAILHSVIERAGPDMPRADTASVVELPGGKLWVVYHKYEPGKSAGKDHGLCRIWCRTSHDGGRAWVEPRMLVDVAPGDMNVQAPAALRLPSGELLMICLRAHGKGSSSSMCLFRSRDDGKTFTEEPPVWRQSEGQWLQGGASSLVLLKSGRILLPFHGGTGNQWKQKNSIGCFVSDDSGHTWRQTPAKIELPKRGAMEASVAELTNGELVMSIRTQLGGPYLSRSRDGGETWTEAQPSGLESGESCTRLRRIPGTDTLLLLWNNSKYVPEGHHHYGERTPLTAAVSSDAGKTWRIVGDIAAEPGAEYTNLGCTFIAKGQAVITYLFGKPAWNREQLSLHAVVIEPAWFQTSATGFSRKTASTLTPSKVAAMECRYFTELLGTTSAKSLASQFDPIENTQVDTIVCCPMGWRFYNYPSRVDLTWKEPDKHPRDLKLFPPWKKMVDNLAAGGDPLKDAVNLARKQKKRFIVSFRMNDSHYVHKEQFPTHNNFWRDHPEYRLGKDPATLHVLGSLCVFNYSIPQVRDFYFAVLEDICANYDVDGVELDFQRAPRFFHNTDLDAGRAIMTAHVKRIREMLDKVGQSRGRRLELGVRVLPTVRANHDIGLDIPAWDAAGHLDSITVSSSYVQTADVGIEDFVASRKNAKIFGELNYLHVQIAGTGHDPNDRRYVVPETYRAATLSFLERGADGVSFFNTYCVPRAELKKLTSDLLTHFKDLDVLNRSDKLYTCYATPVTMFGRIFPARNEKSFEMFIADKLPGRCKNAILRFETKASCNNIRVEAWLNGTKLDAHTPDAVELFPPVTVNKASPKPENLKYFSVPLTALKFGINAVTVKKTDNTRQPCDFTAAELALYTATTQ